MKQVSFFKQKEQYFLEGLGGDLEIFSFFRDLASGQFILVCREDSQFKIYVSAEHNTLGEVSLTQVEDESTSIYFKVVSENGTIHEIVIDYLIDLKEDQVRYSSSYHGVGERRKIKQLNFKVDVTCPDCEGEGFTDESLKVGIGICTECRGTGRFEYQN